MPKHIGQIAFSDTRGAGGKGQQNIPCPESQAAKLCSRMGAHPGNLQEVLMARRSFIAR